MKNQIQILREKTDNITKNIMLYWTVLSLIVLLNACAPNNKETVKTETVKTEEIKTETTKIKNNNVSHCVPANAEKFTQKGEEMLSMYNIEEQQFKKDMWVLVFDINQSFRKSIEQRSVNWKFFQENIQRDTQTFISKNPKYNQLSDKDIFSFILKFWYYTHETFLITSDPVNLDSKFIIPISDITQINTHSDFPKLIDLFERYKQLIPQNTNKYTVDFEDKNTWWEMKPNNLEWFYVLSEANKQLQANEIFHWIVYNILAGLNKQFDPDKMVLLYIQWTPIQARTSEIMQLWSDIAEVMYSENWSLERLVENWVTYNGLSQQWQIENFKDWSRVSASLISMFIWELIQKTPALQQTLQQIQLKDKKTSSKDEIIESFANEVQKYFTPEDLLEWYKQKWITQQIVPILLAE